MPLDYPTLDLSALQPKQRESKKHLSFHLLHACRKMSEFKLDGKLFFRRAQRILNAWKVRGLFGKWKFVAGTRAPCGI
jgi:hypothetical protein